MVVAIEILIFRQQHQEKKFVAIVVVVTAV
jgi:hypothetical protein